MKRVLKWSSLTAALTGAILGATASLANAADKVKVAFVYVGPIGDGGWSYQHHLGLEAVKTEFGGKVQATEVENVSEGPDAERVIDQLAAAGNDIIFTTSFGFMNPTLKVAQRYPNVKFEHATGFKTAPNMAIYNARFYEGRYVVGLIAGKMTKTNTIGYIASFPIPEVVMGINASYLAAKKVNPNVKFKIIWVSTWFDPGKEADAAKALAAQGADIIEQHTDSPAAMKFAEENNIYAVGQSSDMSAFGPRAHLTSIVDNWAPYYMKRVKAMLDGTWKMTDTWDGIKEGMVVLARWSKEVPADVVKMAEEARDGIASGKLHPFTGPIKKQDGTLWLKEGEKATDKDLLSMNFYVEGIEGTLPK
ncbi:MAG TPA: BMP family ABC transporter substrate-binding protein [Hyphomicrobiales bacterium]|nr:BMP family ABC transporter substrate-binding protein [Hyphomicrobiales bacterium]